MSPPDHQNLLWLLKQAFHYSGHTVNEAISQRGVTSAQVGLLRQLADERKTLAELLVRIVVQGHGEVSFTLHPDTD